MAHDDGSNTLNFLTANKLTLLYFMLALMGFDDLSVACTCLLSWVVMS